MLFLLAQLAAVFLSVTLLYREWLKKCKYWKDRKVPHLTPLPIVGNYAPFIFQMRAQFENTHSILKNFPDAPFIGTFFGTDPTIVVQDPQLVKFVMTQEFSSFIDREVGAYSSREAFFRSLPFASGHEWKILRQNMTPVFTSGKMKNMFHLVEKCCRAFEELLDFECMNSDVVNVNDLSERFTMDTLCSSVLGVDTKAMTCADVHSHPFRLIAEKMAERSMLRRFKETVRIMWPAIFYGLGQKAVPDAAIKFFSQLLGGVIKEREGRPATRQDFMDILLQWKVNNCLTGDSLKRNDAGNKEKVTIPVDDDLIIAQCMVFFVAGFETSALTTAFTLLELAKNPECQRKVQSEVDEYLKERGSIKYDITTEMPYLTQCIDEASRIYPVVGALTRECTERIQLPGGPVLSPGDRVHIPVFTLHRDPRHFPEPEKFIPDRFSPENKHNIKPFTYMPFGEGPRICIGMRFAKMQILGSLVTLLKKYDVSPAGPTTPRFEPRSNVSHPLEGILLKLTPRAGWEERCFKKDKEILF